MDFTLPKTISVKHHHLCGTDLPHWQILIDECTWHDEPSYARLHSHHLPVWHRTFHVSTLSWVLQHVMIINCFVPMNTHLNQRRLPSNLFILSSTWLPSTPVMSILCLMTWKINFVVISSSVVTACNPLQSVEHYASFYMVSEFPSAISSWDDSYCH